MEDRKLLVKCPNCTREWVYKGKNNYYACCPDCRKYIPIRNLTHPPMKEGTGEVLE